MPRYYFDIRDGSGYHRDLVGDVFLDFDEARAQAQALLPDIVREELPDGDLHTVVCEMRDDTGKTVYVGELTFRGIRY